MDSDDDRRGSWCVAGTRRVVAAMRRFAVTALGTIAISAGAQIANAAASGDTPPHTAPILEGTVVEVIDGDSLFVQLTSGTIEVRLSAADAPEHDQPGGREAKEALRRRLPRGSHVALEPVEHDRYERLVAVAVQGNESVNEWLVREGYAWAHRRYARDRRYCEFEDEARKARRGVWTLPTSAWIAPWDWRAHARDAAHPLHDYSHETLATCVAAIPQQDARSSSAASRTGANVSSTAAPAGGNCRIKGNIGADGARIYHVPGTTSYERTGIDPYRGERWFCTEAEARAAGWRPPRG